MPIYRAVGIIIIFTTSAEGAPCLNGFVMAELEHIVNTRRYFPFTKGSS